MRRDGFNEVVSFSLPKSATRTVSVKQRLTLRRKVAGDNSMTQVRQDGLSTYVQVCQLISIRLRLNCLNPSRVGFRRPHVMTVLFDVCGNPARTMSAR